MESLSEKARRLMFAAKGRTPRGRTDFENMQDPDAMTRYTYGEGPMLFIGQQIVSAMQKAGKPAKILYGYRSPQEQARLFAQGRTASGPKVTNADAWQSAHNYYMAVDIIHPTLAWKVSDDYWETLAACVRVVAEKFDIELEHGHNWKFRDSAHIEYKGWKNVRHKYGKNHLSAEVLWTLFEELLPAVAKSYVRRKGKPPFDLPHPDLSKIGS